MTLAQTPTEVASDTRAARSSAAARRVAAAAAALVAVGLFMTVASVDVPHDPTDSELLQWWQQQGNRTSGLVSGISAICVAVALAVVMSYLPRLVATERAPQWTAFARSMGAAVSAVWLVTGAARAAVSHLVDVMGEPLPGVDVLRFATALNYTLLGLSGMAVLSLCILAVSVVVFRTQALGRWMGFVGVGCGAVMLAAVLAQYGAYTTPLGILWGLCLAVAIWRQPAS
jgi:multisubunit Na+/H+ antiporter MnhB subunit